MNKPPLVLIPQHFGSLVFDRRNSRYMPFDPQVTALLERAIDAPFALSDQSWPFFQHFYERGFFSIDHRFSGVRLDLSPPADHLAGPLAVHLEVAGSCNLSCSHCFAGPLPKKEEPLTLAQIDGLFAELASMGSFRLGLTGGEPLLRKDLFEIIDQAIEHGLHPCVTTNGLLITEEIAKAFGKRSLLWLNVSLDGASESSNDLVRGIGVYQGVKEKLKLLAKHSRFTLAFTVMRTNLEEIEACAKLAREVGAHTAVFRPLYPVGTAQQNLHLMPTMQEYSDALLRLERSVGPLGGALRGIDPFSPQHRIEGQAKVFSGAGCGAGQLIASVSVQGDVNPCSFLGTGQNAGNIKDHSFHELWHQSPGFVQIRGLSSEPSEFEGGCRARAQNFSGDLNGQDPWHVAWTQQQETLGPTQTLELYDDRS